MKLNKIMITGLALTMAFVMNCKKPDAAGGGDLKSAATEYVALTEKTAAALEAATDGKAAAKALNDAETASNALEAKFPQLKQIDKIPELADLTERYTKAAMSLMGALSKADEKFKADPEFAAVMKKVMKTDGK